MTMESSKRVVLYHDNEIEVSEWAVSEIESIGLTFNDHYISCLLENDSPWKRCGLTILVHYDFLNRKYIGVNGLLGRIIKIDKKDNLIKLYDTVFEAVLDSLNDKYLFSFEKLYLNESTYKKQTQKFFGISIKINTVNPLIQQLNKTIRRCKNKYYGNNKVFLEMFSEEISTNMSFEEYTIQGVRWEAFTFGAYIDSLLREGPVDNDNKYVVHNIEQCKNYDVRLEKLFRRYSKDGQTLFKQIYDLKKAKGLFGIYLLCLPQIKGCYVGQTKKCFATRISQHFTMPHTAFDNTYVPADIREIYILPFRQISNLIDVVEEDCIAFLGKEICLNAVAGGTSIEFIKSENYDPSQYLLSNDLLKATLNIISE